jgi:hypothetical protein
LKITQTKISGRRQRLVLSGWVLAALLLTGYNGSKLMSLLSPPMVSRSMEVRLASQKWRQLQNIISQSSEKMTTEIDLDTAFGKIPPVVEKKIPVQPDQSPAENNEIQHAEMQLPTLSGILRNTDIHGRAYAVAVIDGHRLRENDQMEGFTVQKIKKDGVVIARNGQTWFLGAPDVAYSRVHPNRSGGNDAQ